MEPAFNRYIGIDNSGAVTHESSCKGLSIYVSVRASKADGAEVGSRQTEDDGLIWVNENSNSGACS